MSIEHRSVATSVENNNIEPIQLNEKSSQLNSMKIAKCFVEDLNQLVQETGGRVYVSELSQKLKITDSDCRTLIRRCRELGFSKAVDQYLANGNPADERLLLRSLTAQVENPAQKKLVISEILSLLDQREITRTSAEILTLAFLTREADFEHLDLVYSKIADQKLIGNSIDYLDYFRDDREALGIVPQFENEFAKRLVNEKSYLDRLKPYHEALQLLQVLEKKQIEQELFTRFVSQKEQYPEIQEDLQRIINLSKSLYINKKDSLSADQKVILENLMLSKSEVNFTNNQELAEQIGIKIEYYELALLGNQQKLGIVAKLLKSDAGDTPGLDQALNNLITHDAITPEEHGLISSAYQRHLSRANLLSPIQVEILTVILNQDLVNDSKLIRNLEKHLTYDTNIIRLALNGRSTSKIKNLGLFEILNDQLSNMDLESKTKVIDRLMQSAFDCNLDVLAKLKSYNFVQENLNTLKLRIIDLVAACLKEMPKLPTLTLKECSGQSIAEIRELTHFEKIKLITYYISNQSKISEIANDLDLVYKYRRAMTCAKKDLSIFFNGTIGNQGAIKKLKDNVFAVPQKIELLKLSEADLETSLLNDNSDSFSFINWSTQIISESDHKKALKIVRKIATYQPQKLKDLIKTTIECTKGKANPETRLFLLELDSEIHKSLITFDNGILSKACETAYGKAREYGPNIKPVFWLLNGSAHRLISVPKTCDLFCKMYDGGKSPVGSMFIEELARIVSNPKLYTNDQNFIRFAHRVYDLFINREFALINPRQFTMKERQNLSFLQEKLQEKVQSVSNREIKISNRVSSFYEKYDVQSVIKAFKYNSIKTANSKYGIDFGELIDIAHGAVLKAAQSYNPEKYIENGLRVQSFSGFAVSMICWEINEEVRDRRKRIDRLNTISIDEPIDQDDSNNTMASMLEAVKTSKLTKEQEQELEDIKADLGSLIPVQRRVLELRYALAKAKGDVSEEVSLEAVADIIFAEGLTANRVTFQRVQQILAQALSNLKNKVLTHNTEDWSSFLTNIANVDLPRPYIGKVNKGMLSFGESLNFGDLKAAEGKVVIARIIDLNQLDGKNYEVYVEIADENYRKKLATYCVFIANNKITSAELISDVQ